MRFKKGEGGEQRAGVPVVAVRDMEKGERVRVEWGLDAWVDLWNRVPRDLWFLTP